jgi:hypothetical protein
MMAEMEKKYSSDIKKISFSEQVIVFIRIFVPKPKKQIL